MRAFLREDDAHEGAQFGVAHIWSRVVVWHRVVQILLSWSWLFSSQEHFLEVWEREIIRENFFTRTFATYPVLKWLTRMLTRASSSLGTFMICLYVYCTGRVRVIAGRDYFPMEVDTYLEKISAIFLFVDDHLFLKSLLKPEKISSLAYMQYHLLLVGTNWKGYVLLKGSSGHEGCSGRVVTRSRVIFWIIPNGINKNSSSFVLLSASHSSLAPQRQRWEHGWMTGRELV